MPLELQDVDFKDGEAIANIYISAFFNDPFQKTMFPGVSFEKQVAGVISRWPNNFGNVATHYKKVVDTDTGDTVGYSKWSFAFTTAGGTLQKPAGFPANLELKPPSTPEGLNDPFAIDFTDKVKKIYERVLGDRPQIQLKMLGTHPSYQRRGVASLQLSWAVDLADKENLFCWVDASPVSVPLYKKFGFEVQDEVVCELHETCGGGLYTYTSMMRKPTV